MGAGGKTDSEGPVPVAIPEVARDTSKSSESRSKRLWNSRRSSAFNSSKAGENSTEAHGDSELCCITCCAAVGAYFYSLGAAIKHICCDCDGCSHGTGTESDHDTTGGCCNGDCC